MWPFKPGVRMSVLKQDQFQYDAYSVLETVIMGNPRLYEVVQGEGRVYMKSRTFPMRTACGLQSWRQSLPSWAAGRQSPRPASILQGLGVPVALHQDQMADTDGRLKVKVLLAQALFGQPDIIMLDEPTNNLDIASIDWLEDFFAGLQDTGTRHRCLPRPAFPQYRLHPHRGYRLR